MVVNKYTFCTISLLESILFLCLQDGETALYFACRKGHLDVVKVLLEHNADVSKESKKVRQLLSDLM